MKRAPLGRKTPLKAQDTPLVRRTPLPTKKPLTTTRDLLRGTAKPRPPRNTGPTVTTRKLVIARANNCCERCGRPITGDYSIHHRKPRGMGGTKDPAINSPSNLALLCGSATTPDGCHTAVEKFRQAAMATGWVVPRTADPAKAPIKLADNRWYLLDGEGGRIPTLRPEPLHEEDPLP